MEIEKVCMSKPHARKVASLNLELAGKTHILHDAREKLESAIAGPKGNPWWWDRRVYTLEKEVQKLRHKINKIIAIAQVSPAIAQEITKERENAK